MYSSGIVVTSLIAFKVKKHSCSVVPLMAYKSHEKILLLFLAYVREVGCGIKRIAGLKIATFMCLNSLFQQSKLFT